MDKVMKNIRNILKRKMYFLYWNATPETFEDLETEFIDFILETPELAEIMRRIVLKRKIPREKLVEMFGAYMITHSDMDENRIDVPIFYNAETHKKTKLLDAVQEAFKEDYESHKSGENPFNSEVIKEWSKEQYNKENMTFLRKLYLDIIQEIDLLDTEIYTKIESAKTKGFSFDKESGVLQFSGKSIELSRRKQISDAVLLMRTLADSDKGEWLEKGEILADWGLNEDDRKRATRNKIFNAAEAVNQMVRDETTIADFLEYSTIKARINPSYR